VSSVSQSSGLRPEAVHLRDYNFDKPRLVLASTAGNGPREIYDWHARFAVPADGDRMARVRLEALRATRTMMTGTAASTRLRAGMIFELTEHPVASLNARYLIETVEYGASERSGLEQVWRAIPAATPWRAAGFVHTTGPGGPETGVVVGAPGEEIHPDATGRVRVQFYWDREGKRDDKASTWMRVGQFPLGGSMVLPRIGWDVFVTHHEGDIDRPVVVSHLYDGQHPVPYSLPANKTRTAWQTATTPGGGSSNEIRFEDKAGSEEMFINASKDMNVVVGDNKSEKVGVDLTRKVGANLDVNVGSNFKVTVLGSQSMTIGASETLSVSSARSITVGGSETNTIGGSRNVTAVKGVTLDAKAGRTLTVGGTMTSVSAMGVSRTALGTTNITVGGSWISAAATGLSNMTGGASAETVGGAKLHIGATGCETSVKGALAETVGGAYVIAAGSNAGESSSGPLAVTVGGAFLANAPEIEIEADSEISIRCGGTSLTITSGSIELKSPVIAAPGGAITKKASTIKHN
jgi:type VI secretion system secreted protein VgrG